MPYSKPEKREEEPEPEFCSECHAIPCSCEDNIVMCEAEPHDYENDGEALASAGFGTDEDYGYYGNDW